MKKIGKIQVSLSSEMLPMVIGVVKEAATILHFSQEDILRAELVTEEVFMFLVGESGHSGETRIVLTNGGYYLKISFYFSPVPFPLEALNITLDYNPVQSSFSALGILIAARSVERFIYVHENPRETAIHLIIEKKYPEYSNTSSILPLPPVISRLQYHSGTHEELKQACIRVLDRYHYHVPSFFTYPGKVVDMVESGEYGTIVATDTKGNVYGCMFWKYGPHLIEAFGPYIFQDRPELSEDIVRSVLESVGRSKVIGFLIQYPTPETPFTWFEELPSISPLPPEYDIGSGQYLPLYRELKEDKGALSIVHPDLAPEVTAWYQARDLPRDVISSIPAGEQITGEASFSVETDKNLSLAVIRLRTTGQNIKSLLLNHVQLLQNHDFSIIVYAMDLKDENESLIYPDLKAAGFIPTYILPWSGKGDLLIFRYQGGFS